MNPWKVSIGLALALLVGVPAGWAILDRGSEAGGGPLDGGAGRIDGQPVEVSVPYTMGSVLLRNEADQPAVIEDVQLLGINGPLRVLGVLARSWPPETGPALSSGEEGYPPVEVPATPIEELNVVPVAKTRTEAGTPGEGLQLFFGVELTEAGVAWAEQVEVTYRVGGKKYKERFDQAFFLCGPIDQYFKPGEQLCPTPELEERLPF